MTSPTATHLGVYATPGAAVHRGRRLAFAAFFAVCLLPFQYGGIEQNATVSANYVFLLLPLFLILSRGVIARPRPFLLIWMTIYSLILVTAIILQIDLLPLLPRRLVSFVLFMSVFAYAFARINEDMLVAFKVAIVGVSIVLSLNALVTYVSAGGAELGAEAKNVVGTQRIGFIYILGLWVVAFAQGHGIVRKAGKYGALTVILVGCLLTFSRSSVFAAGGSLLLFVLARAAAWFRHPRLRLRLRYIGGGIALAFVAFAVSRSVPGALAFFDETFVEFVSDSDRLSRHLSDPYYSEGFRIFLAEQVLHHSLRNPLTGAGYLGIWILPAAHSGSAHNQLLDVLFRTGWIGLAGYLYLLWRLMRFLWVEQPALFWGLAGVLLYGLYHETFKESQGAFVLAFLLALMSQGGLRRTPPSRFVHA